MKFHFKRALAVIATFLIVLAGGMLAASPAYAAYACPANTYCIYDQQGGIGTDAANRYYWGPEWNGQCVPIGPTWNDRASSGKNNRVDAGNWKMIVYENAGCSGGVVSNYSLTQGYMGPGQSMNFTGYWNNRASSFKLSL